MNRGSAIKYVAALRSGLYAKEDGCLRSNVGYCAVGVLCDFVSRDSWSDTGLSFFTMDGHCAVAPEAILKKCKCKTDLSELSSMNDNGKTFEEIADYVEQNYEVL